MTFDTSSRLSNSFSCFSNSTHDLL